MSKQNIKKFKKSFSFFVVFVTILWSLGLPFWPGLPKAQTISGYDISYTDDGGPMPNMFLNNPNNINNFLAMGGRPMASAFFSPPIRLGQESMGGFDSPMTISEIQAQEHTEEWAAIYNGPSNNDDSASAIVRDSLGNLYVTGSSYDINSDYATIKYDAAGNELWVRRYDGPGGTDSAAAIAIDSNNDVYITGMSEGIGTGADYATIKYDADGNELWVRRYDGPASSDDSATAIAIDSNNDIYVTGGSEDIGTGADYFTIKYDAAGNELWVRRYNGSMSGNTGNDFATAIAIDSNDNIYVTGVSTEVGTGPDCTTIKYDAAGNELWVKRYDGPANGNDFANAIAIDSNDDIYIAGISESIGTGADCTTIKYDAAGNELWVRRYDGPANGYDSATAIAIDSYDDVYVAGYGYGGGENSGWDWVTIKYDTDGNEIWIKTLNGTANGDDWAYDIAIDLNGNIYVAGESMSGTGADCTIVKYDPSGNELWVKRYDGNGNGWDSIYSIVVDSSFNVYATGCEFDTENKSNYVTIRYSQTVDNTPPGTNVAVEAGADTSITFNNVTTGGNTTSTESEANVQLTDYVSTIMAREITTTAAYDGPITITLYYGDLVAPGFENSIEMLKLNPSTGLWEAPADGTVIDALNKTASGTFDHLCVIALAIKPLETQVRVKPKSINLKSNGVFTVFMDLPTGVEPEQIDLTTFRANDISPQEVNLEGKSKIIAKFQKQGFPFGAGEIIAKVQRVIENQKQIIKGKDNLKIKDK